VLYDEWRQHGGYNADSDRKGGQMRPSDDDAIDTDDHGGGEPGHDEGDDSRFAADPPGPRLEKRRQTDAYQCGCEDAEVDQGFQDEVAVEEVRD
jgi:hypothetical protein